ncbi:solute carrier family 25 member 36-like [Rhopilema esculentum]|uniref:solute carrier family 25 member 36-like n=1 Tax=Rhopilema esculentum TaxID=499914 RepID=UPI0031D96AB9|eukprot:gene713-10424_t
MNKEKHFASEDPKRWRDMIPSSAVHLMAGGIGATMASATTCPLEVVQTRLQSTFLKSFDVVQSPVLNLAGQSGVSTLHLPGGFTFHAQPFLRRNYLYQLFSYMRYMVRTEGTSSLFRGLLPNALGVAPAKSVYFLVYSKVKSTLNESAYFESESRPVFTLAAVCAGLSTSTATNPVWFIKTQLQLHHNQQKLTILDCVQNAYRTHGMRAFFRGMSASYVGIFETIIYFIVYEDIKKRLKSHRHLTNKEKFHISDYVFGSVASKLAATVIMYPHEVVRTRLRQDIKDGNSGQLKYRNFIQTLLTVAKEEGRVGLYGGFGTNLVRQIPNTAICFLVYEAIINFFEEES